VEEREENMSTIKERKIIIAEDQEVTRLSLSYALQKQPGIQIMGEAENGEQAVALLRQTPVHLVLMDVEMPKMNGITATRLIKKQFPQVKVIMLTSHDQAEPVHASLAAGADAYCMKDIKIARLIEVINMVIEGALWLDPAIAQLVMNSFTGKSSKEEKDHPQQYQTNLTEPEWDILDLIAKGKSNPEIEEALLISLPTVQNQVGSLLQKLAVDDRTQIAVKALNEGLTSA
jgi:two-component system NarL family response regulator